MRNETIKWNRMIGMVLILIPILIQIPYTILNIQIQYPEILRKPTEVILKEYHHGGSSLIWTWWFFGISGLPLIFGYLHLYLNTKRFSPLLSISAVIFGVLIGEHLGQLFTIVWMFWCPL